MGNIEEVASASCTRVDDKQAMGSEGAAYLLGLEKMYRPTGVHINDPKGMFILRWYKEVDLHGNALSGHQNKDCVAYKLTLDNDGEPFRWTSNVQLISKVYLKKLMDQPRTYTHHSTKTTPRWWEMPLPNLSCRYIVLQIW